MQLNATEYNWMQLDAKNATELNRMQRNTADYNWIQRSATEYNGVQQILAFSELLSFKLVIRITIQKEEDTYVRYVYVFTNKILCIWIREYLRKNSVCIREELSYFSWKKL